MWEAHVLQNLSHSQIDSEMPALLLPISSQIQPVLPTSIDRRTYLGPIVEFCEITLCELSLQLHVTSC